MGKDAKRMAKREPRRRQAGNTVLRVHNSCLLLTVIRAKNVDVDEVIERVFSNTGGGYLPEPLPLGQMIDILIDFWEADGLFD